ncbi:MAG: carboxypeptidase-like regulatory domain-containing protein [Planctomycetes bacterium]|nr:carboxypeptidase-like regulatory domain-containing protein [Planctomycetota bacterium]
MTVRTWQKELDFPETIALLGGPAATARMTLHDRDGLEAKVRVSGGWRPAHRAEAAPDGTFEIAVPTDLPSFGFEVEAEFACFTQGGDRYEIDGAEAKAGFVLELEPAGKIEGSITGPSGPVTGARVAVVHPTRMFRVEADASGRFAILGVPPGRYRAAALAEGCAPELRENIDALSGTTTRVDFLLHRESSISGRVVGPSGDGIVGARVGAWPEDLEVASALNGISYGASTSGREGRFRIGSLRHGTHKTYASADGFLRSSSNSVEVPPAGGVEGIVLALATGHIVAGRVTDAMGLPVADARVTAETDPDLYDKRGSSKPPVYSRQSCATPGDGTFRLAGLGEGPYVVRAEAIGHQKVEKRNVAPDTERLALVFGAATGIAGVVRAAPGGEPVREFEASLSWIVTMRDASGAPFEFRRDGPSRAFRSEDGAFEWSGLEPGVFDLRIRSGGFVPETLREVAVTAGEVRRGLEVRLRPGAVVTGTVRERPSGSPVPGVLVRVVTREAGMDPMGSGPETSARAEEDGSFSIGGLEPGFFRLRATHDAFVAETTDVLEVAEGGALDGVEIRLGRGGAWMASRGARKESPKRKRTSSFSRRMSSPGRGSKPRPTHRGTSASRGSSRGDTWSGSTREARRGRGRGRKCAGWSPPTPR